MRKWTIELAPNADDGYEAKMTVEGDALQQVEDDAEQLRNALEQIGIAVASVKKVLTLST